jgi:DNA-binding NtrC family response regulator
LHPSALRLLCAYHWPGNIRELRNVMERAAAICAGQVVCSEVLTIGAHQLSGETRASERAAPLLAGRVHAPRQNGIRSQLRDFERDCIARALHHTGGNQTEAARVLGVSRRTLTNRLNALGLERPRKAVGDEPLPGPEGGS